MGCAEEVVTQSLRERQCIWVELHESGGRHFLPPWEVTSAGTLSCDPAQSAPRLHRKLPLKCDRHSGLAAMHTEYFYIACMLMQQLNQAILSMNRPGDLWPLDGTGCTSQPPTDLVAALGKSVEACLKCGVRIRTTASPL